MPGTVAICRRLCCPFKGEDWSRKGGTPLGNHGSRGRRCSLPHLHLTPLRPGDGGEACGLTRPPGEWRLPHGKLMGWH